MAQTLEIKKKIKEYLKNNLDLELNLEKRKINDLGKDSTKFLAYPSALLMERLGYNLQTRKVTRIKGKRDIKLRTDKK